MMTDLLALLIEQKRVVPLGEALTSSPGKVMTITMYIRIPEDSTSSDGVIQIFCVEK